MNIAQKMATIVIAVLLLSCASNDISNQEKSSLLLSDHIYEGQRDQSEFNVIEDQEAWSEFLYGKEVNCEKPITFIETKRGTEYQGVQCHDINTKRID